MLFPVAAALGFFAVLLFGGAVWAVVGGGSDVDTEAARRAVRVLSQRPDKGAADYVRLGRAHSDVGEVGYALNAYRKAVGKGGIDQRGIDYAFAHLKDPLEGGISMKVLSAVRRDDVAEALINAIDDDNLNHRRNALAALELRGEATDSLRERVARQDILSDAPCGMRKTALLVLEEIGRTKEAATAIDEAIKRGSVENSCMSSNLEIVLRKVRERTTE